MSLMILHTEVKQRRSLAMQSTVIGQLLLLWANTFQIPTGFLELIPSCNRGHGPDTVVNQCPHCVLWVKPNLSERSVIIGQLPTIVCDPLRSRMKIPCDPVNCFAQSAEWDRTFKIFGRMGSAIPCDPAHFNHWLAPPWVKPKLRPCHTAVWPVSGPYGRIFF